MALINTGCYYVFGLPLGALLGYKFHLGVRGIWTGMLAGCLLQTIILMVNVFRTNWTKEVMQTKKRMRSYAISPVPEFENGAAIQMMEAQPLASDR